MSLDRQTKSDSSTNHACIGQEYTLLEFQRLFGTEEDEDVLDGENGDYACDDN